MSVEGHRYLWLRRGILGAAVLILAGLMVATILSAQAWANANHPACGCQTSSVPLSLIITTSGLGLATTGLILLFTANFGSEWQRQRRRQRTRQLSSRLVYHRRLGLEYWLSPDRQAWAETLGWIHPRVIISSGLVARLTGSEIEAVLRHEAEHVRRADPLWSGLIQTISRMLRHPSWFRGLVQAVFSLRELSADAAATSHFGQASQLSGALVKLLSPQPAAAVAAFSPNTDRVTKLLDPTWVPYDQTWRRFRRWLVGVSLGGMVAVGLFIGTGQAAANPAGACPASLRERMCLPRTTIVCTYQSGWQCTRLISDGPISSLE